MQWIKHIILSACLTLGVFSVQAAEAPATNGAEVKAVNINTATAEQLSQLDGIGKAKAEAIIAYRNEKGPFVEVAELTQVKGIGEKMLMKIESRVVVAR